MRILFVSPYLPSPVRVRPYNWIRALSRLGHEVHVIAVRPPEDAWVKEEDLARQTAGLEVFPLSRPATLLNALQAVPRGLPLQAAYSEHTGAAARVTELARSGGYDVAHVEHLRGVGLVNRLEGLPCVWDAVDSISALFRQAARLAPTWSHRAIARLDLARTRRFESTMPFRFERVVVTTAPEAEAFVQLAGPAIRSRMAVISNGVDGDEFRPVDRPADATVLFSGKLSYHANIAAALRLVTRIMPIVWMRRPDARVILAGKDPAPSLLRLAGDPRVSVRGFVEDMRTVFAAASVSVCPLVYGAGIQNKVLEAMACGLPVVASRELASSIGAVEDEEWLLGDTDADLAAHILDVVDDPRRSARVGRAARQFVLCHHRWDVLAGRLAGVYADVAARRREAPRALA
jgi:glycosyltransferase involved in cell wall biosynthesis